MTWKIADQRQHLSELHNESRYNRTFHHTLLSIFMAGYIALAIVLVNALNNSPDSTKAIDNVSSAIIIAVAILFLFVIPAILTFLIINYHFALGEIQEQIRNLQVETMYPDEYLENKKYEGFNAKNKYKKYRIGKGHQSFIFLLWIMVFINVGLVLLVTIIG